MTNKLYKKRGFIALVVAALLAGFGMNAGPDVTLLLTDLACQAAECE